MKNYYWSRTPGTFVNKVTGKEFLMNADKSLGPLFQGTVREWYETLIEIINDVVRDVDGCSYCQPPTKLVVSPSVATILEASVSFKPVFPRPKGPCPVQIGTIDHMDLFVDHHHSVDVISLYADDELLGTVTVLNLNAV